jgi:ankyrin repeat protein
MHHVWFGAGQLNFTARTDGHHYTTALGEAVKQRWEAGVRLLLCYGVDVDVPDSSGCTPLLVAARQDQPDLVKLLLQAGADANVVAWGGPGLGLGLSALGKGVPSEGSSAGNYAWRRPPASAVLWQRSGRQVGTTALLECAYGEHVECARLLASGGADVTSCGCHDGLTPLHVAAERCVRLARTPPEAHSGRCQPQPDSASRLVPVQL